MNCNPALKEALIQLNYKLDEELEKLSDNQKFTKEQIVSYLTKRGVSPKEIEAAGINDITGTLTARQLKDLPKDNKLRDLDLEDEYAEYTYKKEGAFKGDYKELGDTIHSSKYKIENTHYDRRYIDNFNTEDNLLGHIRFHTSDIGNKKVLMLNELQSDWAQTERAGRGKFKKSLRPIEKIKEDKTVFARELHKLYSSGYNINSAEVQPIKETIIKLNRELHEAENATPNFPMNEKKYRQLQIVKAINEATKRNLDTILIPIERERNSLVGTKGVTKFYDGLYKSTLKDMEKKLGIKVTRHKEDFIPKPHVKKGELDNLNIEKFEHKLKNITFKDNPLTEKHMINTLKSIKDDISAERYEYLTAVLEAPGEVSLYNSHNADILLRDLTTNLLEKSTTEEQILYSDGNPIKKYVKTLLENTENMPYQSDVFWKIDIPKNIKKSWNVWSAVGALGLAGYATQSKAYTVKPGDTVTKIANAHNIPVKEVMTINHLKSSDIKSGDVLIVPYTAKDAKLSQDKAFGATTDYEVPDYIKSVEGYLSKPAKVMGHPTVGYGYDLLKNAKYKKRDFQLAGIKDINHITEPQASILYKLAANRQNHLVSFALGYDITRVPKYGDILQMLAYGGDIMNNKKQPGHYKAFLLLKNRKFLKALEAFTKIPLSSHRLENRLKNYYNSLRS